MTPRTPFFLHFSAAALLACLSPAALGKTPPPHQLYTGTLGEARIVLELRPGQEDFDYGSYFYTRYRQSITLRKSDTDCPAALCLNEPQDVAPTWQLRQDGHGGYVGEWRGKDKTLPIVLQPVRGMPSGRLTVSTGSPYQTSDAYQNLQNGATPFVATRRTSFMGKTLQWYKHKRTGMEHFLIASGYASAVQNKLNQVLRQNALQKLADRDDCLASTGGERSDFDVTVTPRLFTPHLMSVSVFSNYYCGGAHPDFSDDPINYSIAHQRHLALEDVVWIGKGKPHRFGASLHASSKDFESYANYRKEHLAPWLHATLTKLYPQEMTPEGFEEDTYSMDTFMFPVWYLTPKGLYVSPSLARVIRAAEYPDFSTIPYRLVRQHPGALQLTLPS